MKVGKTSFSVLFPNPLLCAFEVGYHALPGVYAVDMNSWSDFKKVCQQLRTDEAKKRYSTIIIDTVSIATDLCEKFVLAQEDVSSLSEVPWGGGWSRYKKEFSSPLRELSQMGYGIVFIAHSKDVPTGLKDSEGADIKGVQPDINKTGLTVVNQLVDIIGYLSVEFQEDGSTKRYLYTRQTPTVFAGTRYKYLKPKIPFGYESLSNEIANAIEKEAAEGAQITDDTKMTEPRTYKEAIEEAKVLWQKLTAGNNYDNLAKIQGLIENTFGKPMKLSEVSENQLELLETVIDGMRNI